LLCAIIAAELSRRLRQDSVYTEELPPGHRVEEIAVPAAWIGKPVDVGEVLARFGVTMVAVRRRESGAVERVPGSQVLNAGDSLLVIGLSKSIDDLRSGGGW